MNKFLPRYAFLFKDKENNILEITFNTTFFDSDEIYFLAQIPHTISSAVFEKQWNSRKINKLFKYIDYFNLGNKMWYFYFYDYYNWGINLNKSFRTKLDKHGLNAINTNFNFTYNKQEISEEKSLSIFFDKKDEYLAYIRENKDFHVIFDGFDRIEGFSSNVFFDIVPDKKITYNNETIDEIEILASMNETENKPALLKKLKNFCPIYSFDYQGHLVNKETKNNYHRSFPITELIDIVYDVRNGVSAIKSYDSLHYITNVKSIYLYSKDRHLITLNKTELNNWLYKNKDKFNYSKNRWLSPVGYSYNAIISN